MLSPSVIVAGAGPAGSTTARLLAEDGARVTFLEARRFPRDTACAGGVTPKTLRWIPRAALETADHSVHKFEFHGGRLPPIRLNEPGAELTMIRRASFDHAIALAAARLSPWVRTYGTNVVSGQRAPFAFDALEGWPRSAGTSLKT